MNKEFIKNHKTFIKKKQQDIYDCICDIYAVYLNTPGLTKVKEDYYYFITEFLLKD